jgi:hypothetical protein
MILKTNSRFFSEHIESPRSKLEECANEAFSRGMTEIQTKAGTDSSACSPVKTTTKKASKDKNVLSFLRVPDTEGSGARDHGIILTDAL